LGATSRAGYAGAVALQPTMQKLKGGLIMPIFKVGNFNQLAVQFDQTAKVIKATHKREVKFSRTLTVEALPELSFNIEPPTMDLAKSPDKWGLFLKSLTLHESFEGFIFDMFDPENHIYFTSIAWDYSGSPPFVYPPKGAQGADFLIPMKAQTTRQFIGDGVNIWPARIVVGALNLAILVYECDSEVRALGETLVDIHNKIESSKLSTLITAISVSPTLATGIAVGEAVNELMGVIGNIMKRNGDDYVDLFEGSYGTDKPQKARVEKYDHAELAGIELEFTVS